MNKEQCIARILEEYTKLYSTLSHSEVVCNSCLLQARAMVLDSIGAFSHYEDDWHLPEQLEPLVRAHMRLTDRK